MKLRVPTITVTLLFASFLSLSIQPLLSPWLNELAPHVWQVIQGQGTEVPIQFRAEAAITVIKHGLYPIHYPTGIWFVYAFQIFGVLGAVSWPVMFAVRRGKPVSRPAKSTEKTSEIQQPSPPPKPTVDPSKYLPSVLKEMKWDAPKRDEA